MSLPPELHPLQRDREPRNVPATETSKEQSPRRWSDVFQSAAGNLAIQNLVAAAPQLKQRSGGASGIYEEEADAAARTAVAITGVPAGALPLTAPLVNHHTNGIHPKLTISQPNDPAEEEADRIADQVIRMPDPGSARRPASVVGDERLQPRYPARAPGEPCPKCEDEQKVQTKDLPGHTPHLTPKLESLLPSLRTGGQALGPSVRAFFEPRLGLDLSQVRVHTDLQAAESAKRIEARAYTYRNDIVFGTNEYAPETNEGRRLLAHELTHTIQQGGVGPARYQINRVDRQNDIDTATSERSLSVQRKQETTEIPVIPEAVFTLDDRYRAAISAGDWAQAAVLLNGFNDADIQARVDDTTVLPPASRLQLRLHTPDWAFRVRRPLLIRDYEDAKAAGQWAQAATLLNGFNDTDIQLLASKLTPSEVGPMVHGAREAMGTGLNRVLSGIIHRYDEVSPDPPGTKALTVVGLMQSAGMSAKAASAYVQLKLGVRVAAGKASAGSAGGDGALADYTADVNAFAAAMKHSAVMAAAAGPGAPQPLPPAQLEGGNLAHELIGDTYCASNPPSVFDLSIIDILTFAKGNVPGLAKAIKATQADLFLNFDMRPDIIDLGKMQIFEIKPAGSTALAVSEALLYVELFDALGIPNLSFTLGHPGNPGTRGMIPGPEAILVWASPLPGAIIYAFVHPPESPGRVQERIESGAYEPGLNLGPEAWIALGSAAAFALVAAWEITPAAVLTFEALIPRLAAAALAAGQAIPPLIPAASSL